jgi:hypothetical protein
MLGAEPLTFKPALAFVDTARRGGSLRLFAFIRCRMIRKTCGTKWSASVEFLPYRHPSLIAGGTTDAPWLLSRYEMAFWTVSRHEQRYANSSSRRQSSIRFLSWAEGGCRDHSSLWGVRTAWPFMTTSTFASYNMCHEGADWFELPHITRAARDHIGVSMKIAVVMLCILFPASLSLASCTKNARGQTVCSDGQSAAAYNPNTGKGATANKNSNGVTTTQTTSGGKSKTKNGKGVATGPNGTTCAKGVNNAGCTPK